MIKKGNYLLLALALILPVIFSSCGSDSKSKNVPDVTIITDPGTGSGGSDTNGNTVPVIEIAPDENGLPVNGELLDPDSYNGSSEAVINAADENGDTCNVTVSDDGTIIITPADGDINGIYTVTIITDDREYELVITVQEGAVAGITGTSTISGYSMVLNLEQGTADNGDDTITVTSTGLLSGYGLDDSVAGIVVKDKNGSVVASEVDPVTGDILVKGEGSGPYTIILTMDDGSVVTITSDINGTITGINVNGSTMILNLDAGAVEYSGIDLALTSAESGIWSLADGVQILSVTAAGGSVTIDLSNVWINQANGDIMILGTVTPAGPYTIKVSVDGEIYIIMTDASGNVTGIIPGNTLLVLTEGYVTHCGNNVVQVASGNTGAWALSGNISNLSAKDADGNNVNVSINSVNGNMSTPGSFTDPVTIVFDYLNAKGDVITYTLVVAHGDLVSYQALITDPGSNFDFSTVTNVKISLSVVDEKTGLAIGQASINLVNSDGTYKWEGFTNNNGISIFEATVESAANTAKIVVSRESYQSVDCVISGIGELIEFGKKIAMKPVDDAVVVDSDGDGVADSDEDPEFVNDPTAAKAITGVYTLAFEDLYPNRGDADFNDLVVRLSIREIIDGQNKVRRIELKTKLLASGAGYKNSFAINILGERYMLIANPKAVSDYTLGSDRNSEPGYAYHNCQEQTHETIVFSSGVDRSELGPMPYDPFIICNGNEDNQVHLPSAATDFTGIVRDSEGFTWAVIVPEDWAWPYENTTDYHWHNVRWMNHPNSIFAAYPEFEAWYKSGGESNTEWYLNPDTRYVFTK